MVCGGGVGAGTLKLRALESAVVSSCSNSSENTKAKALSTLKAEHFTEEVTTVFIPA